jgi:hypothetical protein
MDGLSCRWSSSYGIAFLRAPSPGEGATIRITCRTIVPTGLEVRVDGDRRGCFALEPGGWCELTVAADALSDFVRVDILPTTIFRRSELSPGTADDRLLGVAVARVSVE